MLCVRDIRVRLAMSDIVLSCHIIFNPLFDYTALKFDIKCITLNTLYFIKSPLSYEKEIKYVTYYIITAIII